MSTSLSSHTAELPYYFVCYSREQRGFAEKIERKLQPRRARGELEVWRDVRNLDMWEEFTPKILEALRNAAGAIVLVSDSWYASDYIQTYEWPTVKACRERDPSFQIFLLAYNALDDDDPLRKRNFVNDIQRELLVKSRPAMRDTILTRLSNLVGEHARMRCPRVTPPVTAPTERTVSGQPSTGEGIAEPDIASDTDGALNDVPDLPEHFREPDQLVAFTRAVADGLQGRTCGLLGEGGTGKSVLAAAIARRSAPRFHDGVYWLTVGEFATSEDVRRLQVDLLTSFGGGQSPPTDISDGAKQLGEALAGRTALIVIDDVWHPWQARAFATAGVDHSRLLFTTRFVEALPDGAAVIHVPRLEPDQATLFLEQGPSGVPGDPHDRAAVLDAAGGLRLALAVFAATADAEGSWAPVLARLDGLAERFGQGDDASSAHKALYVALDTMDAADRSLASSLGAFPADAAIPVDLLARMWNTTAEDAQRLVRTLVAKNLAAYANGDVTLHDHVHDFLILQSQAPTSDVHLRLWELASGLRHHGWSALIEEIPYLWDRLVWHACRAGLNRKSLWDLVSDLGWLELRIRREGAAAAGQDVGTVCEVTDVADDAPLSLLRGVLRHGGLFDTADADAGLGVSLTAWADVLGLRHRQRRRLRSGALPVPSPGLKQTLRGHTSEAWAVRFLSNGRGLVTCSEDANAVVWDIRSGQILRTLAGHTGRVWKLAVSRDETRVATASEDGTARIWTTENGRLLHILEAHSGEVWGVAFSRDGNRLATCGEDGSAKLWDVTTGQHLRTLNVGRPLWDIAFDPDGHRVAAAGGGIDADGASRPLVCMWDSGTGKPCPTGSDHTAQVRAITFSPDGSQILTGSDDGTARVWDIAAGMTTMLLSGHANAVWSVAFSADGQLAATGSDDGSARVWDARTGAQLLALNGHSSTVHGVTFSADARQLATCGGDGTARIWSVSSSPDTVPRLPSTAHDVALDAANTRLLVAVGDGTVRMFETGSGEELRAFGGHDAAVWGVAWSPDERRIASSGEDRTARVFDACTGALLVTLTGHTGQVWDVKFSRDGRQVITVSEDSTVRLWDSDTGQELCRLNGHRGRVWEVGLSFDGRRMATGGDFGSARVWHIDRRVEQMSLGDHTGAIWDVVFSPDDQHLATAAEDGKARIWDLASGGLRHELSGHTGQVWGVAFNTDGTLLATAGGDGTIRIWEAHSARPVMTLPVACSGPMSWRRDMLAIAAGRHWAILNVPGFASDLASAAGDGAPREH
ncbi:NB-ARC domain-containing protein [Mycobacterium sp. IS-1742]|uniref:NB-ARC domain-containing protein n=1 Tax=Mycobacterium sp. IS-1742 TaxID=1772285 RepID=UPI000AF27363|nr:NB-ARC domain-containing protein [Mycobacterium sp. IS-1742]